MGVLHLVISQRVSVETTLLQYFCTLLICDNCFQVDHAYGWNKVVLLAQKQVASNDVDDYLPLKNAGMNGPQSPTKMKANNISRHFCTLGLW